MTMKRSVSPVMEFDMDILDLPEVEYEWWRRAIARDDVEAVRRTLAQADSAQRKRLLNGKFQIITEPLHHAGKAIVAEVYTQVSFERPWCLAVVCGSFQVLSVFREYHIDVTATDHRGSNAIHLLIYLAYLDPERESTNVKIYNFLEQTLALDELSELLHSEGHHNRYPLEMASWLGAFSLFKTIFETDGIYLHREDINSVYVLEKYDITEYENNSERRWKSPLLNLLFLDYGQVENDDTQLIYDSKVIKNWMKLKKDGCFPFIVIWFLIRIAFFIVYILYDNAGGWSKFNESKVKRVLEMELFAGLENFTLSSENVSRSANETKTCLVAITEGGVSISTAVYLLLAFYLVLHCLCILLVDVFDIIAILTCCRKYIIGAASTPRCHKNVVLNFLFYRIIQSLLALACIIGSLSSVSGQYFGASLDRNTLNLLYVTISFGIIWSLLFFIQLMPWIGYFIICVQHMILDLSKFLILFLMFSFPYATSFLMLLNQEKTDGQCSENFDSIGGSFYSVFLAMINMVNFRAENPVDENSTFVLHMIFVFTVPVLLLNFLVANFSNTLSIINGHKNVFQTVQWLTIIYTLDARLGFTTRGLYDKHIQKGFLREGGRVYVPVLACRSLSNQACDGVGIGECLGKSEKEYVACERL